MNRCTSGLRSLIDATLYASEMAWAIVRSRTSRPLMKTFCGPRLGPVSASGATYPSTLMPAVSRRTSMRSADSP